MFNDKPSVHSTHQTTVRRTSIPRRRSQGVEPTLWQSPFSSRYQLIEEETKNFFIYKILLCVIFI